ncbi:hypothetical protein VTK56DRAFT_3787 [Thermocarpiscus australiensis]
MDTSISSSVHLGILSSSWPQRPVVFFDDFAHVEPVYWRCSKPACNPDGQQGWLKAMSCDAPFVQKTRYPGMTRTRIANPYRPRLIFSTPKSRWEEFLPPRSTTLPCLGTTLVFPEESYSEAACVCRPTHSSILYNSLKEPIGLLGGLNLLPWRLDPAGWACCVHYRSEPPIPLAEGYKGPCNTCVLVNGWGEPLLFMDAARYVAPNGPYPGTTTTLPSEDSDRYPNGPLKDHLLHWTGLRRTGSLQRVVNRTVGPCLAAELQGLLHLTSVDDPREMVEEMAAIVRITRTAWSHQ